MLIESGKILKQVIKSEGLTQTEFCRRIGINKKQLNKAIAINDFSDDLIGRISGYFGVDMSYLQVEKLGIKQGAGRKKQNR